MKYDLSKLPKFLILLLLSLASASLSYRGGLNFHQSVVVWIFSISIFGSLFFWDFRLGFMFIGSSVYLFIGAVTPEDFVRFASLEVILFLISMMIVVGMMKEAGIFNWLITKLLKIERLTGRKLFIILMLVSAVFSSMMGEVTSIMIIVMTILGICDLLEIDPVPLVISSIIATNIGSAATVLGNPVGILIASKSGLSFEDFFAHALPNAAVNLAGAIIFLLFLNRKYINRLSKSLTVYTEDKAFIKLISIPSDRKTKVSIVIFCVTFALISLHKRLELILGLHENTLLLMFPICSAGIVLMYRHEKSRHYIEDEIEWPSIIFFMFLFAQAGVIQATGVAQLLAEKLISFTDGRSEILVGIILFSSGILSSILDNVVAVASYMPLINSMEAVTTANSNLWWALLFGACYGGNITMIGSTANIVALGILERELGYNMTFIQWFKIGFVVGLFSMVVSFLLMIYFPFF